MTQATPSRRPALSVGMRWSGISVVGREGARMVFTVVLARLVGPEAFGIVAQAAVYIALVGLLLDQGFSSALIQRPSLTPDMPGAVVTLNLAGGCTLAALTVAVAPAWAAFMNTPELTLVLSLLAPSLLLRAACVTPRALLLRRMEFRRLGVADVGAAVVGGVLGVASAFLGAGYWALVVQIVSTDAAMLLGLLLLRAVPAPNLRLRRLRDIAGFSVRTFAAGTLGTLSRNIDNLLVGRFQGPEALAFYGLGYRLLLLPIQLLTVTIGNVLFPAFSRLASDLSAIRSEMLRATRGLASVVIPAMALLAAAAPQIVVLVFGPDWEPAVRIVQVLAVAGAVQAIYQPSTVPLVLGLGHAKLVLRLALVDNTVLIIGIVLGVPFSPLAVAVGYTLSTLSLIPLEWWIRRHLLSLTFLTQARTLVPGVHVGLWIAATYTLLASVVGGNDAVALAAGAPAATLIGILVMRLVHRAQFTELTHIMSRVVGQTGHEVAAALPGEGTS